MKYKANTVSDYINNIPKDRKFVIKKLRKILNTNLPKGFFEQINYNMIGYVVPHSLYLDGYHCNPKLPLPFIHIASQKNFIALYHSGIYANPDLLKWFITQYSKHCKYKLDMGKSCIRFKKMDDIPYQLIEELVKKISPEQWIEIYESILKR